MRELLDAFWRAAAYCLLPRVIALSILPLLIAAGLALGMSYFYWEPAIAGLRALLEDWVWSAAFFDWLDTLGAGWVRALLAPLMIISVAVPVIVVVSLLLVALITTPALVSLVAERRFVGLERRRGAGLLRSALWSLACTVLALLLLALTIPLWLIPPLVLVLPPLIWGWLTYRVMSFDVLAEHASADERRRILRERRWPLFGIGVVAGYLGAAPSLVWAVSAATLVLAPLLVVVSVWLYTLVFAFAALWFAHYALAALHALRKNEARLSSTPPLEALSVEMNQAPPQLPPAL
jgi:Etoposide-induced protein 2.4 (EI24)